MTTGVGHGEVIAGDDLASRLLSSLTGEYAAALAETILALAAAAALISQLLGRGPLAGALGAETMDHNSAGDPQKRADVLANNLVLAALADTPTAFFASEEEDAILDLDWQGVLAVAVDPLDGSSNIDINGPVGTIFSIFPASPAGGPASFFRPGRDQIAAGYFLYGPQTALVLTYGAGVDLFVLDPKQNRFLRVRSHLTIPLEAREFAINASNYRHWSQPVQRFVDECLAGSEGPRGKDFNMRWPAAMVADAHRILTRGGVYLYPADRRRGYESGRLRLIYEAFPIAWLVEAAGGGATDGRWAILDKIPAELHERTPLVFGSARTVEAVAEAHAGSATQEAKAPLFGHRGLFRI